MRNRKGFAFLETIVIILVLSTSMLLLYTSYKNIFDNEKGNLYYDDVAHIFSSYFIANEILNKYNFNFNNIDFKTNASMTEISLNSLGMKEYADFFAVNQVLLVKPEFKLIKNCDFDDNKVCTENECKLCIDSLDKIDYEFAQYIKKINYNEENYLLIIKYHENRNGNKCIEEEKCINYYNWLDTGVKYE